ncbi:hypothetical protein HNP38_000577 [Chryseobacterium defluvii]|uniref:Uncharacterized protein n=1 Tax=Chryseobacterium defluvii TaxID=160396 RepID=A0A840KA54_9FLAO|nr:peptidylprolyl isomerase [Chryseobacterium defluvii]MBB4805305.1 hypothetical protein [Chryseobacterium defluvii]
MKSIFLVFSVLVVQFCFSQKVKNVQKKESKNTQQKFSLDKGQIALFDGQFVKFIAALQSSDRKAMENLLSPKAKQAITDNVYKKLSTDINFNKKLVIFKTGYKSMIGGGNYPMIQYKYSDDVSEFPKEIITAVFEENGKILGIKPYKQEK